jgi:hypothetical protein
MVTRRWLGYLVLLGVFVLGAVAGGASVFAVLQRRNAARLLDDREDERRLVALTRHLDLDVSQRERIAVVLNDARHETRVIAHQTDLKCGHPLLDLREKVDAQVRAELRPDQQSRFDDLLAARRRREAALAPPAAE